MFLAFPLKPTMCQLVPPVCARPQHHNARGCSFFAHCLYSQSVLPSSFYTHNFLTVACCSVPGHKGSRKVLFNQPPYTHTQIHTQTCKHTNERIHTPTHTLTHTHTYIHPSLRLTLRSFSSLALKCWVLAPRKACVGWFQQKPPSPMPQTHERPRLIPPRSISLSSSLCGSQRPICAHNNALSAGRELPHSLAWSSLQWPATEVPIELEQSLTKGHITPRLVSTDPNTCFHWCSLLRALNSHRHLQTFWQSLSKSSDKDFRTAHGISTSASVHHIWC